MSILGTRVVRTEDPRLLTAGGTYVDDLRVPELAQAARVTFVRSPVAHAAITGIDVSAAKDAPGVVAVLTVADMDDLPPPPPDSGLTGTEGAPLPFGGPWAEPLLAVDRVRFVGEPVAIVLTDERYQGEDAAELVSVDYEPLPAAASVDAALAGETLLFPGTESNVAWTTGVTGNGSAGDSSMFDGCDRAGQRTIINQRLPPGAEGGAAPPATLGGGPVRDPAGADRVPGRGHQHDADQRLPRRRTAGGDRRDRAGRRPVRRGDRHGPGRGAPDQPGAARRVPVQLPVRGHLRHRRLRGGAGQGAGRSGLPGAEGRAGPAARARRRAAAGHRAGELRGDHRGGRGGRRDRPAPRARPRHGHGLHPQFCPPARPSHGRGHCPRVRAWHPPGDKHAHP